jgi:hypothetical protein
MDEIMVKNVNIPSGKDYLKGRIYLPNKNGAHPTLAICHGYPGDTKNMDLAEELAFNGYVTLIFFYKGGWGSAGNWSFSNLDPSTIDAISYLKRLPYVNPERIGLISHSMGALPLTKRLAEDEKLKTGVLVSPAADLSLWIREETIDTMVPIFLHMAEGKLKGLNEESLRIGMKKARKELNPKDNIKKVNRPVMIIVGSNDQVTSPKSCRELFEEANEPKVYIEVEHADHGFSEHRYQLMNHVLEWLKEQL